MGFNLSIKLCLQHLLNDPAAEMEMINRFVSPKSTTVHMSESSFKVILYASEFNKIRSLRRLLKLKWRAAINLILVYYMK